MSYLLGRAVQVADRDDFVFPWPGCVTAKLPARTPTGLLGARPPFACFHSQCPFLGDFPGKTALAAVGPSMRIDAANQAAGTWVLLWEQVPVGAMSPVWCEQKNLQQISMIGFGTWLVGWKDGTGEGRGAKHTRKSQIDCLPG